MRNFSCANCGHFLFFENVQCISCGHRVAYSVAQDAIVTLALERGTDGTEDAAYELVDDRQHGGTFRLCANTVLYNACNWLIPEGDSARYCASCRLTEILPDLSNPATQVAWMKVETAKRRLLVSLFGLGLPVTGRDDAPDGLAFRFLESTETEPAMTGHDKGIITLDIAEADGAFRENMREKLGEAYRTVLGHLRHEIGHYYWDQLVQNSPQRLARFREVFGDERASYEAAIQRHYDEGPPPDWQTCFISAYATMHPWEDWAETWAHYLHMTDTLDTARTYGIAISAPGVTGDRERMRATVVDPDEFDDLFNSWYMLTFVLNGLSRSMGVPDLYPFAASTKARAKIAWVHDLVQSEAAAARARA